MKPLSIDFLPPRLAPVWALVACALALAAALATSLWAWSTYGDAKVRLMQLQAVQQDQQAAAAATQAARPTRVLTPYETDARRAAQESGFSTAQALAALEHVVMVGVTPVSVELQAESGLSRVEVEFVDQPVLLKYLAELNSGEAQPRWQLLRATAKGAGQANGMAVLEARW